MCPPQNIASAQTTVDGEIGERRPEESGIEPLPEQEVGKRELEQLSAEPQREEGDDRQSRTPDEQQAMRRAEVEPRQRDRFEGETAPRSTPKAASARGRH